MRWHLSKSGRFDKRAVALADRHYSREKIGSPQFVAPGKNVVFVNGDGSAAWVTLFQALADHAWRGAWNNSFFRNESRALSSELITEALAATRWAWGDPPTEGLITFIDAEATEARRSRRPLPGHCYRVAGFEEVGRTKVHGKIVLHLPPEKWPDPCAPLGVPLVGARSLFVR